MQGSRIDGVYGVRVIDKFVGFRGQDVISSRLGIGFRIVGLALKV